MDNVSFGGYEPCKFVKFMSFAMSRIRNLYYLKSFGVEFVSKELKFQSIQSDFANLKATVSSCELCVLSKKREKPLIESEFKTAKVMIVDSFASKDESKSGILLACQRGEILLNAIKSTLGLEKSEIYMSYVYKCFCGGKNDALARQRCLPYLWREFELVKPRVLLVLGEDSFENLGFDDFKRLRGELFTHKNAWIMPSFSLEFVFKNPSFEKEFIDDLNKIKGLL